MPQIMTIANERYGRVCEGIVVEFNDEGFSSSFPDVVDVNWGGKSLRARRSFLASHHKTPDQGFSILSIYNTSTKRK